MIQLRKLRLRRGSKIVLDGADVTLHPGEKVGLVGRNGAGKSSLFALLAGRLAADAGDLSMPPSWRVAEVAQDMPDSDRPATEFVLDGDQPLRAAEAQLAQAEACGDGQAMAEAHVALQDAGAFDARSRAQAMLMGLGFAAARLDDPVNRFSGGWRMRLQLARALMAPADVLLLDEPTNHLDLDALVWLEQWLRQHPALVIVISHDRDFLDAVTQATLHLDQARLTRWAGGYSAFEERHAEAMSQQQAAAARQQERIAHLQRFIDRFKAKASKAKQAQSRVKALARMERIAPVLASSDLDFAFREPLALPNPMLALDRLDCGYPPAEPGGAPRAIVRGVQRTVLAGQRIGILGANGQGKSTLVKTIAGTLTPLAGSMTAGKGLAIGYFAQHELDLLDGRDTPLERMVRLARETGRAQAPEAREQALRDFLGQFRFGGEMVQQRVDTLSGGERARLVLATLVWQRPNLLLLDEPTNHLDLSMREALSVALNGFEGSVLLVSHDRAMLREVCDEFWIVTGGALHPFDGDLDDYQRWLLDVARATAKGLPMPPLPDARGIEPEASAAQAAVKAAPAPRPAAAADAPRGGRDARKASAQARAEQASRTRPLRIELQQVEARLAALNEERAALQARFAANDLGSDEIADAGRRDNHAAAEIAMLEERWLELEQALEEAAGAA